MVGNLAALNSDFLKKFHFVEIRVRLAHGLHGTGMGSLFPPYAPGAGVILHEFTVPISQPMLSI